MQKIETTPCNDCPLKNRNIDSIRGTDWQVSRLSWDERVSVLHCLMYAVGAYLQWCQKNDISPSYLDLNQAFFKDVTGGPSGATTQHELIYRHQSSEIGAIRWGCEGRSGWDRLQKHGLFSIQEEQS